MALARNAVTRVAQTAVGRRAASTDVASTAAKAAISPLLNMKNNVPQNMAYYQAPGVGTIDVHPTFLKGKMDRVAIPVVLGAILCVGVPLAVSGITDMLFSKNKKAWAQ